MYVSVYALNSHTHFHILLSFMIRLWFGLAALETEPRALHKATELHTQSCKIRFCSVCICVSVDVCTRGCRCPLRPAKDFRSPTAEVTGDCELLDVGAQN